MSSLFSVFLWPQQKNPGVAVTELPEFVEGWVPGVWQPAENSRRRFGPTPAQFSLIQGHRVSLAR